MYKMQISIRLTKKEYEYLHYESWKLQSLENLINIFMINVHNFDYKDEIIDKILGKYIEAFANIQEFILTLAKKNDVKNININKYSYMFDEETLYFKNNHNKKKNQLF